MASVNASRTPPVPLIRAFEFRCPGRRRDGRLCNKLLLRGDPRGDFTIHCGRCGKTVRYREVSVADLPASR